MGGSLKASEIIRDVTIRASSEGVEATAAATERLGRAGDAAVVSAERQARSALSVDRAYERLQRSIDATYRQSQLFEQGQRTLDRALQQGRITAEAYDRSMGLLSTRYGTTSAAVNDNTATLSRFERQTGLASHQVTNLGYQLNDVAVSLAGGQSPFTVLFQQGSQILPILSAAPGGIGGALAGIGRYLIGLVNPATAAAAAVAAVGALAYVGLSRASAEAEMLEKALTGLGRSTPATAAGLARIAEAAATQGKVTAAAAKETAAALASTGQIGISNFESLIGISKQFAAALGLDAAEANAKLASSFADPVKGADDLNGKLNFLSDATRSYIRELAAQNDQTGAQRALLDALGPALANATANTTLLGRAWAYVANMASSAAAAIASALKGPSPEQALQSARSRLEDISTGLMARTPTGQARIKDAQNDLMGLEEQYRRNGAAAAAASKAMSDEATTNKISVQAGDITRALNPLAVKYDEIRQKTDTLKKALETPSKLSDVKATQDAYDAYGRALSTLTDSQGKLISSTDLLRQNDELAVAAKKATSDAEKASIAERQKSLDLVGELITKEEAARRVSHAGALERIKDAKGGGSAAKESSDAYDNALQRSRDSIEELKLQQEQASKTTEEVYRLTEAHKLRRAALSAGRSEEAGVTEAINAQAEAYARQRVATEAAIEAQKRFQESARETAETISSFVKDLVGGKGLDAALKSLGQTYLSNSIDALISGKGPFASALGLAPATKGGAGGILNLDWNKLTKAVTEGTSQGTFSGFSNLFGSPQQGPTQSGATVDTTSGGVNISGIAGIGGAALGAYGAGASSGALAGGLTGAISGAAAGAAFGPAGMAIGAILGAGAGILGASSAKAKAKEARKAEAEANYKEAAPQIASLGSQFRGDPQNTLEMQIAEAEAAQKKLGDIAYLSGRGAEADKLFADFVTYKDRVIGEFRDGFIGFIDAMNVGLGPNSPFASAKQNVKDLGVELLGFIDNAKLAFGDSSAQVEQARQASAAYALAVLDGQKSLSIVQTRMQEINGTAAGLSKILADLGMSADAAAAAVDEGVVGAMARLKTSFETDLTRKTLDAQDKGYINETADLFTEIVSLYKDAAALGSSAGAVNDYFQSAAQAIVDGAQLSGEAFDDLIKRFPDLNGHVKAFEEAIDAASKSAEIASRRLGYQDRLFNATNDSDTLVGQLAAYDRQALRDREAEIKAGGEAIADLEAAQLVERFNIIRDFNKAANDNYRQSLAQAQDYIARFANSIREYLDGLRAGSDSPLSPQARLAAAQSQYNAQLGLAQGGNRDALDGITGYASDLLEAAKGFYASSSGFQSIFAQIQSQLGALPSQISAEQFIVNAIEDGADQTTDAIAVMRTTLQSAVNSGSAQEIAGALATYFNKIDTNTDNTISFQEMSTALGGMASNSSLRDMFTRLDTDNSGGLSRLELIKNATQGAEIYTLQTKQVLDNQTSLLNAANSLVSTSNNLTAASNSLIDYSNLIGNTQSGILSAIQGLQGTAATQLQLLNSQLTQQATVGIQGVTVQGNLVDNMRKVVFNTAVANQRFSVNGNSPSVPYTFAQGGYVDGPGTGTSDSISARLSNGEFVMRAAAVDRFGVGMLDRMNDNFAMPAMAVPVPVGAGGGDMRAVVAELKALRAELAAHKAATVKAAVAGAEHVREGVDEVAAGQRDTAREMRVKAA